MTSPALAPKDRAGGVGAATRPHPLAGELCFTDGTIGSGTIRPFNAGRILDPGRRPPTHTRRSVSGKNPGILGGKLLNFGKV